MKKFISLSLAFLMIFLMCSCNKSLTEENTTEKQEDVSLEIGTSEANSANEPVENPERLYITSCNTQHFSGFGDLEFETDEYIRFYEYNDDVIMETKTHNIHDDGHSIVVLRFNDDDIITLATYEKYDSQLNLVDKGNYTIDYSGSNITKITDVYDVSYNYEYNEDNQIIAVKSDGINRTFQYDNNGRLTKFSHKGYGYTNFTYGENGLISEIYEGADISQNRENQKSEYEYNEHMQLLSITTKFDDESVINTKKATLDDFGRIANVTTNFPAVDGSEGDTYTCDYTYENGNITSYTAYDKCTTLCTTDDMHNLKKYESKSEYNNITTTFGYEELTSREIKMCEIFSTYFLDTLTSSGSFELREAKLNNSMLSDLGTCHYLQIEDYPYIVITAIYNNI